MHWDWRPAPAMVTPFPPRRPAVRRARQGGGDVRARAASDSGDGPIAPLAKAPQFDAVRARRNATG